ncbi:MAG: DMT family transporter [bacterium]|nr:DMT family transporter [bacterium]
MPLRYIGELAGLTSSLFLAIGPTLFTLAGRLAGSQNVNRLRLLLAALLMLMLHGIIFGSPLPLDAGGERWFWLSLSGLIGFVLGDACLFKAFVMIGTRLTMLVFSLSPIVAVLIARLWLGETLAGMKILAIFITLSGVIWVVSDRNGQTGADTHTRHYLRGLLFASGGAVGQALGMITAKKGLFGDIPALSGLTIRICAGALALWLIALFSKRIGSTIRTFRTRPRSILFTAGGTMAGPAIGVYLSLVALKYTEVGVACTLMALPPVFLLPIGRIVFGERIGLRAVLGTLIALGGVTLLFFSDTL